MPGKRISSVLSWLNIGEVMMEIYFATKIVLGSPFLNIITTLVHFFVLKGKIEI